MRVSTRTFSIWFYSFWIIIIYFGEMERTVWENPIWLKLIWITNLIQENKSLRYRILNFMLSVWYDIRQRPKSCEWICLVPIEKTWFFVNFHVLYSFGVKNKKPNKTKLHSKTKSASGCATKRIEYETFYKLFVIQKFCLHPENLTLNFKWSFKLLYGFLHWNLFLHIMQHILLYLYLWTKFYSIVAYTIWNRT